MSVIDGTSHLMLVESRLEINPIIVIIIQFPPLIKPNFRRLCHYCATKNGTFGHKNVVCKKYHFAHHVDFQLVTSQKDA